jgi:hypothetical protein
MSMTSIRWKDYPAEFKAHLILFLCIYGIGEMFLGSQAKIFEMITLYILAIISMDISFYRMEKELIEWDSGQMKKNRRY